MGRPVNSKVQREETSSLNTTVNKNILDNFRDSLGKYGYPMNMMLEIFMRQYIDGEIELSEDDVAKHKDSGAEEVTLATTINKEIYLSFKSICKDKDLYMKHVLTAFMEKYVDGGYVLEYVKVLKE